MENKTDLDWKILFYKTVVLLPLFVPAIYLIFETNRQREKEERYQELGMRISASAPYLENMEEKLLEKNMSSEKITELKIELAKKFFSEKLQHSNSHKKGFSQKEMLRLFEEMLKTLKKD